MLFCLFLALLICWTIAFCWKTHWDAIVGEPLPEEPLPSFKRESRSNDKMPDYSKQVYCLFASFLIFLTVLQWV